MKPNLTFWLYIGVSVTNVIAQVIQSEEIIRYTKPLLMPLLMYYVYVHSKGRVTARILLLSLALLFSWGGDIALMYQGSGAFIAGVGLFLAAQVTYIVVLGKSTFSSLSFSMAKVLPFIVYAGVLFYFLLPKAGDLFIPIVLYGIVIVSMAAIASLREGLTSRGSYMLAFTGSLFFVLSDSILAIDKFAWEVPFEGPLIMGTYVVAQYLLANGVLEHID